MKRLLLCVAVLAIACRSTTSSNRSARTTLCARLQGAGPSSDALDPEHEGFGVLTLEGTVIHYDIRVPNLAQVIATHIHHGEIGTNGPMLWEINPGYTGDATRGVATEVPPGVIALLMNFPTEFYLKLHSLQYPGGAIRGQLEPCRAR